VADVAAQLRQRDEDLRRVRDDVAPAHAPSFRQELVQRRVEHAMSIRFGGKVTDVDAHVLVPLKRLDLAKTRLADSLAPDERGQLMRGLLDGVIEAIQAAEVGQVTVVTGESLDGVEIFDDRGLPWNEALEAAMREVVQEEIATVISADLPFLRPDEVRALVDATPTCGIAIGRALDGGTNAVSMRPPALVRTHFGETRSAAVHAALGVEAVVLDLPGLAFDVDTPADLQRMRAATAA
jgi:2-phospho-L-lactate guanylyltransferase